jgi:hypothetical protein
MEGWMDRQTAVCNRIFPVDFLWWRGADIMKFRLVVRASPNSSPILCSSVTVD